MKFEDAILTIKTFFLEVLGFLIPGFFFTCSLSLCLSDNLQNYIIKLIKVDYINYIVLIISYVTGYFLYGVFELKRAMFSILGKPMILSKLRVFTTQKVDHKLNNEIPKSTEFKISYNLLLKHLGLSDAELPNTNYRTIRNIMMSYFPGLDNKIYTFMFRADLSKNIATSLQLMSVLGLVSILYEKWSLYDAPLKNDYHHIFLYIILILIAIPLNKTYERFYGIAMRIIFSNFIAGIQPIIKNEK